MQDRYLHFLAFAGRAPAGDAPAALLPAFLGLARLLDLGEHPASPECSLLALTVSRGAATVPIEGAGSFRVTSLARKKAMEFNAYLKQMTEDAR